MKGFISEMGIKGAAIATSVGSFFQMAVLFYFFLKQENRERYGTGTVFHQRKISFAMS